MNYLPKPGKIPILEFNHNSKTWYIYESTFIPDPNKDRTALGIPGRNIDKVIEFLEGHYGNVLLHRIFNLNSDTALMELYNVLQTEEFRTKYIPKHPDDIFSWASIDSEIPIPVRNIEHAAARINMIAAERGFILSGTEGWILQNLRAEGESNETTD